MSSSSNRKEERTVLLGSFVALLVSSVLVTRLLIAAWTDHGLVYDAVLDVAHVLPVPPQLVIVVPTGVLLGTMLLFLLDEYKRIQAILLAIAAVPAFGLTLWTSDRWVTVAWGNHVEALVLSIGVGILLGGYRGEFRYWPFEDDRTTFPTAPRLMSGVVTVTVLVGYIQHHGHVLWTDGLSLTNVVWAALSAVLVLVFLVVVSYFVQYEDRKDIVVLGPDGSQLMNLLAGMLETAERRYDGQIIEGNRRLNEAISKQSRSNVEPLRGPVAFQYYRPGLVRHRTVVSASRTRTLSSTIVDHLEDRATSSGPRWNSIRRITSRRLWLLVPRTLRELLTTPGKRRIERLVTADVVLLVVPLEDALRLDRLDDDNTDDTDGVYRDLPEYVRRYDDGATALEELGVQPIVVATQGDFAVPLYQVEKTARRSDPDLDSGPFVNFVLNSVLDLDSRRELQIVSRQPRATTGEKLRGFDPLLRKRI